MKTKLVIVMLCLVCAVQSQIEAQVVTNRVEQLGQLWNFYGHARGLRFNTVMLGPIKSEPLYRVDLKELKVAAGSKQTLLALLRKTLAQIPGYYELHGKKEAEVFLIAPSIGLGTESKIRGVLATDGSVIPLDVSYYTLLEEQAKRLEKEGDRTYWELTPPTKDADGLIYRVPCFHRWDFGRKLIE